MNQITTKATKFLGRNGQFKCKGFTMFKYRDAVRIHPITSRGRDGRCFIEVDGSDLGDFIRALKEEHLFGLDPDRRIQEG